MGKCVFVCHAADDKEIAKLLSAKLEENGISCWIAPRDILPGLAWGEAIIDAITESPVMVFVFSSCSNNSPHVLRELERAVSKGIPVIPFRVANIVPSKSIEYFITTAHWLDAFPEPSEKHFEILVETVRQLLARKYKCDRIDSVQTALDDATDSGALQRKDTETTVDQGSPGQRSVNEYENDLHVAEDLLRREQWVSCIKQSGDLLEKAMRYLLGDFVDPSRDRKLHEKIIAAKRKIGQGEVPVERLKLDQLVSVYNESEVFEELRRKITSNLHRTRKIDWIQVLKWHSASGNTQDSVELREDNAMHMVYWAKIFVYDCELVGPVEKISSVSAEAGSLEECPCCKERLKNNWKFCPECGEALRVTCDACDRPLAPAFRICPYCETRVIRRGIAQTDAARRAKEEYRFLCTGAYLDGVVNVRERTLLENKRLELGLSSEEAERIERQCAPENVLEYTHFVEGVLVDGVINEAERVFLQKKAELMNIDPWVAGQIEQVAIEMRKRSPGDNQPKR